MILRGNAGPVAQIIPRCPKCGGHGAELSKMYCEGPTPPNKVCKHSNFSEHVAIECICGFKWNAPCVDRQPRTKGVGQ